MRWVAILSYISKASKCLLTNGIALFLNSLLHDLLQYAKVISAWTCWSGGIGISSAHQHPIKNFSKYVGPVVVNGLTTGIFEILLSLQMSLCYPAIRHTLACQTASNLNFLNNNGVSGKCDGIAKVWWFTAVEKYFCFLVYYENR